MNINVRKCEGVFEILQGFNDKPATKCEQCGGRLKKIISLSAFHLKGAGWYETDYGKKRISEPQQIKDNASGEAATDTAASSESASVTSETGPSDPAKVFDSIKSDTKKTKQKTKNS